MDVVTRQPIAPNGGYRSSSGEQSELQSVKGTRQRLAPDRRLAKVSHLRLRRAGMCPDRPVLRVGQWSGNFMAADKRGQCCRLARYCGYVSRSVGDVVSFGQVEQDEDVAERVCHDGHPADRDVEGLGHYPPAGCPDRGGWPVGGGDKPVRFITLLGCEDDLRIAAGQGQAGLADVIVAPPQLCVKSLALADAEGGAAPSGIPPSSTRRRGQNTPDR